MAVNLPKIMYANSVKVFLLSFLPFFKSVKQHGGTMKYIADLAFGLITNDRAF
jgi:hypothetical protein